MTECILASSIVVYSANGATKSVCRIAERIKDAVELQAEGRHIYLPLEAGEVQGEFADGSLAYNVFVVTGKCFPFNIQAA
jgi:hypothetical protein